MEIPSHFFDNTFSMELMRDPVSTADGHSFERSDIEQWVRVSGTNPVTRAPLALNQLTPNRALKGAIEEFLSINQQVRTQIERLQQQRRAAQRDRWNAVAEGLGHHCGAAPSERWPGRDDPLHLRDLALHHGRPRHCSGRARL